MILQNEDSNIYTIKPLSGWKLLATLDEGQSYEVDITEIWQTPEGFSLMTASGCSCWDGDYDQEDFTSLPLLALHLLKDDRQFGPSLEGALELLSDAYRNRDTSVTRAN